MKNFLKIIKNPKVVVVALAVIIFLALWYWPQEKIIPEYGATFSAKYARELQLSARETLENIFSDLGIRKIRLVAYWDEIEKEPGKFDFSDLDWQIEMSKEYGAEIILAVGRRVPRWPECHVPHWALQLERVEQNEALLNFVEATAQRYRDEESIAIWQVENEPFLTSYAKQYCGEFDKSFLEKEIAVVKNIDPSTPIMLTDSGELGLWSGAYRRADYFGSTLYVYVANYFFDDVRSFMSHNSYRLKQATMNILHGKKESYLIELSLEPWLTKPIVQTSFSDQLEKMNTRRARIILDIAAQSGFTKQYLWGPEWWYYLKINGYPELWSFLKSEIQKTNSK